MRASNALSAPYQSILGPSDALRLVRVRVGEALYLTSLSSEEAVEVGADLVAFTFFQVVALSASCLGAVSQHSIVISE